MRPAGLQGEARLPLSSISDRNQEGKPSRAIMKTKSLRELSRQTFTAEPSGICDTATFIGNGADEIVIQPSRGWVPLNLKEIWEYRELLYFLCWRDIKLRYKQTVLGAAWAILQPFMTMVVFSLFFGRLAGLDHKTGGVPYPIYVYAGLLPWTFFANSISNSGNSLISSSNLITKVYFPRLVIP